MRLLGDLMGLVSITDTQRALLRARDSLGCSLGTLRHNDSARAGDLTLLRKGAPGKVRMNVATPAQDRGMILGMSLLGGHRRRVREGTRRSGRMFDRNGVYIHEFDVDYAAQAEGAFDFLLIELPAGSAFARHRTVLITAFARWSRGCWAGWQRRICIRSFWGRSSACG